MMTCCLNATRNIKSNTQNKYNNSVEIKFNFYCCAQQKRPQFHWWWSCKHQWMCPFVTFGKACGTVVVLVRIIWNINISPTSKGWATCWMAVDCFWILDQRIFCGRDVVRVGESEAEPICMIFACASAVPWKDTVASKEMAIVGADDTECGSFVVTLFVKVCCCKTITKKYIK